MWDFLDKLLNIGGILSFFWAISQYLYYNKISFFIKINQIVSRNKDVNFEVSLAAMDPVPDLNLMLKKSREVFEYETKIISRSKNKIVFSVDTMIIEIRNDYNLDPNLDDEYKFEMFIKNANSTYTVATKNLKILDNLFNELESKFNLKNPRYSFKSVFPKKNPFIGPVITKTGFDKIKTFYMILSADVLEQDLIADENIQINLTEISFVEHRFSQVREVANIILAI